MRTIEKVELSVEIVEEWIDWPASEWPGKCYQVANAIIDSRLVDGVAVCGHWTGPVAPETLFAGRAGAWPFVHHGWIETGPATAPVPYIIDPTRFVFEGVAPYIYQGWDESGYYDPGGDKWRRSMESPPPLYHPDQRPADISFDDALAEQAVMTMLRHPPQITVEQVFWLANLSRKTLGGLAKPLYRALEASYQAFIPIDNWRIIMERDNGK